MFTGLNDQLGVTQGRIQPTNHTPSVLDDPEAAVLTSQQSETFALTDGIELLVSIDGGTTETVTFNTGDFVDIEAATAAEVAIVIGSTLTGASAADVGGAVAITTTETGPDASITIVGGAANNVLQFPTSAVGTQGQYSFVLGNDIPGRVVRLEGGDSVTLSQAADFTIDPVASVRITGAVNVQTAAMPVGYEWELTVGVNGVGSVTRNITDAEGEGFSTFLLDDFGINTSQLGAGSMTFEVTLTLTGPATPVDVTLPGVYLDFLTFADEADNLFLIDRYPAPGQTRVPNELDRLHLTIGRQGASAVDPAATTVEVEGVTVYDGSAGGFQAGYTGPLSSASFAGGMSGTDAVIQVDLSTLTFTDEQEVNVRVVADTVATGDAIDVSYAYTMEDIDQPQATAATPQSKSVIRVSFNEDMLMDATAAGALNPANYDIAIASSPAVTVTPTAAAQVSSSVVDLTLDMETTQGASYDLTVGASVEDDDGNVMDPAVSVVSFVGLTPTAPDGRRFQVLDFWPSFNRAEDEAGVKALRKWSLIMQDILDQLLCDVDEWTKILDPDVAPEDFLDAILCDLGNPFDFAELTLIDKRRLARILVDIYKEKGTEVGIINAIRFFVGVDVTLDIINCRSFWQVGVSTLGVGTTIGPGAGDPLWYSFSIVSPVTLTTTQRDRILLIADYMKAAHEHVIGIEEPGLTDPIPSYWTLGISALGAETVLQ